MINVFMYLKYDKCLIKIQVHHESISIPPLSHFQKTLLTEQLSFIGPSMSCALCNISPHWCEFFSYNSVVHIPCPPGLWFLIIIEPWSLPSPPKFPCCASQSILNYTFFTFNPQYFPLHIRDLKSIQIPTSLGLQTYAGASFSSIPLARVHCAQKMHRFSLQASLFPSPTCLLKL